MTTQPVRPTDLLGVWQLRRRLVDRHAGGFGTVTGWLELTLVGATVHWLELGQLHWGGATYEVTRELHVVPDGPGWLVRFTDGRPFHAWRPGQVVTHPCRADVYRGLIRVDPARTSLRVLWDVTGPGKEQRIVTRCRRRPELVRPVSPAGSARSDPSLRG